MSVKKGACVGVVMVFHAAFARAGAGQSGGLLLQQPFGARGFALGDAYAALADDAFGLTYNPASLTRLVKSQVDAEFIKGLEGSSLGYLSAASPLSPTQALGLGLSTFDAGKADIFDGNGALTRSVTAQKDMAGRLGYAWSRPLGSGRLHLGASGAFYDSSVANDAHASSFAADLGAIYERPFGRDVLAAAASVSNLGAGLNYSGGLASGSQSTALPRVIRIAFGYEKDLFAYDRLTAGLSLDQYSPDSYILAGLGFEYLYHGLCALRFGYRFGSTDGGLRTGFGLKYKDIAVDYSLGFGQTFNNVQRLSVSYAFSIPGLRYRKDASAFGDLPQKAQTALSAKHYLSAWEQLDRMDSAFGKSPESRAIRRLVQNDIEAMTGDQNSAFAQAYVRAFKAYRNGEWAEMAETLDELRRAKPDDGELREFGEIARDHLLKLKQTLELQALARTGTLFEIANQAFEDGDTARARRIVDEILRLGRYQPAESLKARIAAKSAKPAQPKTPPPDTARAEELYYDAVRHYAENDLAKALEELHRGLSLDPANANIRSTLERIENERRQRAREGQSR